MALTAILQIQIIQAHQDLGAQVGAFVVAAEQSSRPATIHSRAA
ncbi:hypothetical protein [Bosea thiooxidans]|nr:hypothetical protein [Bosea thiooxidans]